MSVNFKSIILYTDIPVTAMLSVQILQAVTFVNVKKVSLEMGLTVMVRIVPYSGIMF